MARRVPPIRLSAAMTALVLLVGGLSALPAAAQQGDCDPFTSPANFTGAIPTATEVLGFELGSQEATVQQSDDYLEAIDDASERVTSDTAGFSVEGRPLEYAIAGTPEHVTQEGLAEIQDAIAALRDPETSAQDAAELAETTPAILYVQANVHGGEESGTEASLKLLYELADRDDCVTDTILGNAIVVVLPVQNPDGREADTRRNAYDIDMNRDWFARTQPETDAKLELLRQYPPVLDLDVHEMGDYTYFFPPNSDPVYHEIADRANGWINDLYGPALAAEFDRQHLRFFNYEPYDFFGTFYGDTVPTMAYGAAGMTYEKASKRSAARPDVRAVRHVARRRVRGGVAQAGHPDRLARLLGRSAGRGRGRNAGAQRGLPEGAPGHRGGPERGGRAPLLPAERRRQGLRGAAPGPAAATDGRRRVPAHRAARGRRLPCVRRGRRTGRRCRRARTGSRWRSPPSTGSSRC